MENNHVGLSDDQISKLVSDQAKSHFPQPSVYPTTKGRNISSKKSRMDMQKGNRLEEAIIDEIDKATLESETVPSTWADEKGRGKSKPTTTHAKTVLTQSIKKQGGKGKSYGKPKPNKILKESTASKGKKEVLTSQEMVTVQLESMETQIVAHIHSEAFYELGQALSAIQKGKLYRLKHKTFNDYLHEKWDMHKTRAYQLITAFNVMACLKMGRIRNQKRVYFDRLPANEAQVRPLTMLKPKKQLEIWEKVLEKSNGGRISARLVEDVVDESAGKKKSKKPSLSTLIFENLTELLKPVNKINDLTQHFSEEELFDIFDKINTEYKLRPGIDFHYNKTDTTYRIQLKNGVLLKLVFFDPPHAIDPDDRWEALEMDICEANEAGLWFHPGNIIAARYQLKQLYDLFSPLA